MSFVTHGRIDEVTLAAEEYLHNDMTGDACAACRGQVIAGSFYITVAGLILKGVIGFLCGSRALMADAMHGLADTLCFGINYIGSHAAPANQQKADLGSNCVIGSVIILSGVWVFADSTAAIASGTLARPGLFGFIVAAITAIVNWRLYRVECPNARKGGSTIPPASCARFRIKRTSMRHACAWRVCSWQMQVSSFSIQFVP